MLRADGTQTEGAFLSQLDRISIHGGVSARPGCSGTKKEVQGAPRGRQQKPENDANYARTKREDKDLGQVDQSADFSQLTQESADRRFRLFTLNCSAHICRGFKRVLTRFVAANWRDLFETQATSRACRRQHAGSGAKPQTSGFQRAACRP